MTKPVCPNCGAVLDVPEDVGQLVTRCSFCQTAVDLPDRDRRIATQHRRQQAEQSQALVRAHLQSAQVMQRRVMLLIFSIVFVTMGIVFYRVFFGGPQ